MKISVVFCREVGIMTSSSTETGTTNMSLSKNTFGSTFTRSTPYPGATAYRVEVKDGIFANTPNEVVRVVVTKGTIKTFLHRAGVYTGIEAGTYYRKDGWTVEEVLRNTIRRYGNCAA